jgi:ribosomal protein S27AE
MSVYQLVARAIREGVLVRQPCERCETAKTEAHHEDYSRPLDVVWLCRKCHSLRHREQRNKKTQITFTVAPAVVDQLDAVCERLHVSRSALMTMWLMERLEREAA